MQVDERPSSRPASREPRAASTSRMLLSIAAAWVVSLGVDLLLHGGLLAKLYVQPSPFLLEADEAFRRIPLGYLAFLGLTAGLYWLFRLLDVRGAVAGFQHGATAGAIVWGAFIVGLYSISTARSGLLTGWWLGQTVELGVAGAVLAAAADGASLKRIWVWVAATVAGCVVVTVALQSLGFAPPMRVTR